MSRPKHIIKSLDNSSVRLINENFRSALDELELSNFAGGEINTGDVIINNSYVQTNNIITGTQEIIVNPGDNIQDKINSIAATGGIVVIRNGYYALDYDIVVPSGIYLRGETVEGVVLDFIDNTHGIKVVGANAYSTGTATATTGSDVITGSGTAWSTETAPGQKILIGESWVQIIDVVSDTELQIETPFSWPTVTGGSYVIASTIDDIEVRTLTVYNADYGILCQYANNFAIDSVYSILCGVGIQILDSASFDLGDQYNIFNLYGSIFNNVSLAAISGFYSLGAAAGSGHTIVLMSNSTISNCAASQSVDNGIELTGCSNVVIGGTIQSNTNDGVYIDTCADISLSNLASQQNGGNGVSIVGSTNIALDVTVTTQNVGNGVNVSGSQMVLSTNGHTGENGGWGILYDATCSDCGVIGTGFHNNVTGDISDSGIDTTIGGTTGTGTKNLNNLLPDQALNAGKVLKTDGTEATWQAEAGGEETDPVFTAWDKDYADLSNKPDLSSLHAPGSDNQDLSGLVEKVTGYSLVADTEIAKIHASGSDNQDLSGLIAKTTNITALNETGIADGELAVFNLTNKDIRTSNVTIATSIGADHTTVPTSQAVAEAITAGGGYTDEDAQDAVGGILTNTGNVQFTYTDATPSITASVDLSGKQDTLVSATNIKTINSNSILGSGDLVISGGGITWSVVVASGNLAVNTGTITNSISLITLTLPATAALGDTIRVAGVSDGLWKIAQNAGQTIYFIDTPTTTGVTGHISSTKSFDSVELVCTKANTDFVVISSTGNITIV